MKWKNKMKIYQIEIKKGWTAWFCKWLCKDKHLEMATSKSVLKYLEIIGQRCFENDYKEKFK